MTTAAKAATIGGVMTAALPAMARLEDLTSREAISGLKTALEKGSQAAIATLGRADGFLGNPQVKIPLPDSLERGERLLRRVGMGRYADELIVGINRAAEAAVPEARALLVESIRKMSVQDAKGILTGGDTAATDYFRRTTRQQLHARFLPIVEKATAKVDLARTYEQYAGRAAGLGLLGREEADLDAYVTAKALDGLYFMIAEEEKKIRKDPAAAGSAILKKVFGAIGL
jgi:hypothetical protein